MCDRRSVVVVHERIHDVVEIPRKAASNDEVREKSQKVSYFKGIYSKVRRGIIARDEFIDASNVMQLQDMRGRHKLFHALRIAIMHDDLRLFLTVQHLLNELPGVTKRAPVRMKPA